MHVTLNCLFKYTLSGCSLVKRKTYMYSCGICTEITRVELLHCWVWVNKEPTNFMLLILLFRACCLVVHTNRKAQTFSHSLLNLYFLMLVISLSVSSLFMAVQALLNVDRITLCLDSIQWETRNYIIADTTSVYAKSFS